MIIFFLLACSVSLPSQSALANIIQESRDSPTNSSGLQRISRAMFEVPRVPNSKHSQDHHNPRYENYDENEDHFENRYDDMNNEELSSPCTLLVERLKERLLRDQARIVVYGFSESAVVGKLKIIFENKHFLVFRCLDLTLLLWRSALLQPRVCCSSD